MTQKKANGLKGVIMALLIALVIGAIVYRFANTDSKSGEEVDLVEVSAVQQVLSRNLATNYPQTPKEVVKYFGEISKCYYNETFESDDELIALADQMLLLYDDELVEYNDHSAYIFDLKNQINYYNANKYKLSNVVPQASTDVDYFTEDGYEWARIYAVFTIKSGKFYKDINECFILRKDENSHWRIYGWKEEDEG